MTHLDLHVLTAGIAVVQDLGRPGRAHLGVSLNGAADSYAATVANVLVGNEPPAPLIETTGSAFACATSSSAVVAVTGAADRVVVDGVAQPAWETLVLRPGQRVEVAAPVRGLRSYLAVRGRIEVTPVLGSVSPDGLLGVGRHLRAGDVLGVTTEFTGLDHPFSRMPVFRFGAQLPPIGQPILVETTPGPDADEFPTGVGGWDSDYEVSPQSDHVGLRLRGPVPARSTTTEILSRGVPVGAVEVPPGCGLLVLLRGRLLTAGYPVVAVATTTAVDRLGQARPGDRVRFTSVDLAQAQSTARRQRDDVARLATRVRAAFNAVGLRQT